jgi:hypothetical protein
MIPQMDLVLIQGTGMHHVETSLPRNHIIRGQTSMFLFDNLFDHSGDKSRLPETLLPPGLT